MSFDINKVSFEEEQTIPNTHEKSRKSQSITEWCRCGEWGALHTNVVYLSCGKIEAFIYFLLLDMRYNNKECGHQKC